MLIRWQKRKSMSVYTNDNSEQLVSQRAGCGQAACPDFCEGRTTARGASTRPVKFELLKVTTVVKSKQRDSRDSYPAPKYLISEGRYCCLGRSQHVDLSIWWDFTHFCGVEELFMLYKDFKSTGENLYHPHPCVNVVCQTTRKGGWQMWYSMCNKQVYLGYLTSAEAFFEADLPLWNVWQCLRLYCEKHHTHLW